MGRHGERGSAALFVVGALAISTATGVLVYIAIKDARAAAAADAAETVQARPPAPVPDEPVPADPLPTEPDRAEQPAPPAPPAENAEATAREPGEGELIGIPGVEGQLDKDAVLAAVRGAQPRLEKCEASIGGSVHVILEVNRRGGVTQASARGGDEALGTCAAKALESVRFARTKDAGTAKVVVPLVFARPSAATPCDEVSCVLDNYEPACCAKFRQPRGAVAASPDLQDSPSRSELSAALIADRRAVSTCAVAANFEGTLKVKIKITPAGQVATVSVEDAEPALGICVARVIKKHTFSASRNGASVAFPYNVPL